MKQAYTPYTKMYRKRALKIGKNMLQPADLGVLVTLVILSDDWNIGLHVL